MMSTRFAENSRRADIDAATQLAQRAATFGQLVGQLQNTLALENAAILTATAVPAFDSGAFTTHASGSGKVKIRAMITVDNAIAGSTAVAAEDYLFQLRQDGAVQASEPEVKFTLSANGKASATIVWIVANAPGATHTYGIQASNVTTPAHTIGVQVHETALNLEEQP